VPAFSGAEGIVIFKKIALCLIANVIFSGGPSAQAQEAPDKDYVETVGIGIADPTIHNITQRRAAARDAAIVQAQRRMLSIVNGSTPQAPVAPGEIPPPPSPLDAKIDKAIQRVRVMETEWANDDSCTVTLRLDREHFEVITGAKLKGD
jgi:hypothetical protein